MEKFHSYSMTYGVMDIETYNDQSTIIPYCICFKYLDTYYYFWENNIIINFLEKICEVSTSNDIILFTHNINFDGILVLEDIKYKNIKYDMFIREYNIYWIKIFYLKCVITIRCSYKLIPLSVKSMGDLINEPKQIFPYKFVRKDNLDYIGEIPKPFYFNNLNEYNQFLLTNNTFNLKEKTIEYCYRDIDIVANVLKEIISIIIENCKSLFIIKNSFSFSSISYKIFVKKYDIFGISDKKNNLFEHNYIKNSYYGGRCEVFGNPNLDDIVHYFDFKGMYSQCMSEEFPIEHSFFKNKDLNINEIGFHTITFKCDDYLPFLPYRSNKLLFANGEMTGVYWHEEILNAVKKNRCTILKHHSSYVFLKKDYIFKSYVTYFNDIREKGRYYKIFGKNMNNGLYGSFALNDTEDEFIVCTNEVEFNSYVKNVDVKNFSKIGNSYIIKVEKNVKSASILDKKGKWDLGYKKRNIAYASIISSKARIKLNNSLNDVLKSGGKLYYTDTDSIFAGYSKSRIYENLNDITWSNIYKDAVFISSKFYYLLDSELKIKGVSTNNYTFDEIKHFFYSDKDLLIFKNQLNFDKKNLTLKQREVDKKIYINIYDKRKFSKDKFKTTPLNIIPDILDI